MMTFSRLEKSHLIHPKIDFTHQIKLIGTWKHHSVPEFYQHLFTNHLKKMDKAKAELTIKQQIKSINSTNSPIQQFMRIVSEKQKVQEFVILTIKKDNGRISEKNVSLICHYISKLRDYNYKASYCLQRMKQKYEEGLHVKASVQKQFFSTFAISLDNFRKQHLQPYIRKIFICEEDYDPFYMNIRQDLQHITKKIHSLFIDLNTIEIDDSYKYLKMKKILYSWMINRQKLLQYIGKGSTNHLQLPIVNQSKDMNLLSPIRASQSQIQNSPYSPYNFNKTKYNNKLYEHSSLNKAQISKPYPNRYESKYILSNSIISTTQKQRKISQIGRIMKNNSTRLKSQASNKDQSLADINKYSFSIQKKTIEQEDEIGHNRYNGRKLKTISTYEKDSYNNSYPQLTHEKYVARNQQYLSKIMNPSLAAVEHHKRKQATNKFQNTLLINISINPQPKPTQIHHNTPSQNSSSASFLYNEKTKIMPTNIHEIYIQQSPQERLKKEQELQRKEQERRAAQLRRIQFELKQEQLKRRQIEMRQEQIRLRQLERMAQERRRKALRQKQQELKRRELERKTEQLKQRQQAQKNQQLRRKKLQLQAAQQQRKQFEKRQQQLLKKQYELKASQLQKKQFEQKAQEIRRKQQQLQKQKLQKREQEKRQQQLRRKQYQMKAQKLRLKELQMKAEQLQRRQLQRKAEQLQRRQMEMKGELQRRQLEIKAEEMRNRQQQRKRNKQIERKAEQLKRKQMQIQAEEQRRKEEELAKISQSKSLPANELKQDIKIKVGKLTIQALKQYLTTYNFNEDYLKLYDLKKILSLCSYNQTYLTEFFVNNQPSAIGLSNLLPPKNTFAIKFWALSKSADANLAQLLFKKYLEYIQKCIINEQIFYKGQFFKQLSLCGFELLKDNLYNRHRKSKPRQIVTQFQQFLYCQCSQLNFIQKQQEDIFFSEELEPFQSDNSYAPDFIFNYNAENCPTQLRNLIQMQEDIGNFQDVNAILSQEGMDGYQINKKTGINGIKLTKMIYQTQIKDVFVASDGYFKFYGTQIYSQGDKLIYSVKLTNNNGKINFGKGFNSIQQFSTLSKKQQNNKKVQFLVPMFSKNLYGRYNKINAKDKGYYGNWLISLVWEDQMQGVVKHSVKNGLELGMEFYVGVQVENIQVYCFKVKGDDFVY